MAKQQACVDCHNAYLNGSVPWKLNDIMGAFVIDVPVDGFMADARNQSLLIAVLFFVIAAPVAGLVARLMHLRRRAAIEAATSAERARVALEAQHAAEAASRSKSRFLALMSHELRTPLNAVIGFSEIIEQELSGPLPPDYRSYARDIHQSGRHLLRIIGDILDLAKAESNHMELDEEAVRLEEVVEPCLRLSAPHADKAGVSLGATLESDIIVRGDVTKLRQILLNLLSNAIKFTESGGRVRFDGSRDRDGSLSLTIVDDGMGMRQEDLPRAFSAFEQVDSTLHRRHEGAGLGLPLARALTELHGGELRIDSTIGLGTKVTVTLPAIRVTGSPASQVEEAPSLNWHVGDGLFHPAPAPT